MGHGCHDCGSPNSCDCEPGDSAKRKAERDRAEPPEKMIERRLAGIITSDLAKELARRLK